MVSEASPDGGFPRPCVITAGVMKGGDCKTWTALNLASRLGCMGYRVTAVDLNQTSDLYSDWERIKRSGYWPRFDVVTFPPIANGVLRSGLNLEPLSDRDFIILDTAQYIQFKTTDWAWRNCHMMIMPVTPNAQQFGNYIAGIEFLRSLPRPRPIVAILPCKLNKMRNQVADQQLDDLLEQWRTLAEEGILVPPMRSSDLRIPEDKVVQSMYTRWIYSVVEYRGKPRHLSNDFLLRVDLSLTWLVHVLSHHWGSLPAPSLDPISVSPYDRAVTVKALKAEWETRMSAEAPAGLVRQG